MSNQLNDRGAGLLLVVLVLLSLGLTAGMLTVSMRLAVDDRATSETQRKMRSLAEAISATNFSSGALTQRHFEQDAGTLPTALDDLLSKPAALGTCYMTTSSNGLGGWCGPYWGTQFSGENAFADGWGNTLILSTSTRTIRSKGPNGADNSGGGDDLVHAY
jgi:hypothetical protein